MSPARPNSDTPSISIPASALLRARLYIFAARLIPRHAKLWRKSPHVVCVSATTRNFPKMTTKTHSKTRETVPVFGIGHVCFRGKRVALQAGKTYIWVVRRARKPRHHSIWVALQVRSAWSWQCCQLGGPSAILAGATALFSLVW